MTVPKEIPEFTEALHPRGHHVFFGALDPSKLTFAERSLRKLPAARAALPDGDFRDGRRHLVRNPLPAAAARTALTEVLVPAHRATGEAGHQLAKPATGSRTDRPDLPEPSTRLNSNPQPRLTADTCALGPGRHPSLSVIRSQDRRVACRLCVPQEV